MSDCRFGVSPVNYPDPDPDPERTWVDLPRNINKMSLGVNGIQR